MLQFHILLTENHLKKTHKKKARSHINTGSDFMSTFLFFDLLSVIVPS